MSLFDKLLKPSLTGLAFASMLALSACSSFSPVYSAATVSEADIEIAYAEPASRTEQIIYQELRSRLGESSSPSAPLAKLAVSSSASAMTRTDAAGPNNAVRLTLSAALTLSSRDGSGSAPAVISRTATAEFTTNDQVLSNEAARLDAEERAARAVAESLRLAVLASLSR